MKSLILAFVFAIGFMSALPAESSGSNAPPSQSCFVVDHQFCDIAATANPSQITFVIDHFVAVNEIIVEKGGGVDVQVFNLVTQPTNLLALKKSIASTDFTQFYNYDFRLCLTKEGLINQSTSLKNIESDYPVTIRADSQRV